MDYLKLLDTVFLTPLSIGVLEFPFNLLELLLQMVLPMALILIVLRIMNATLNRLLSRSSIREVIQGGIKLWTKRLFRIITVIVFFTLLGRLFGARIYEYLKIFANTLNQPLLESGSTKISFLTIILVIPVFYLASWAGKYSRNLISRDLMKRMGLDEARQFSFVSLMRYVVMIIVFMVGLSVIGVNLSSITVIFGVLGIGVGFGLQNVVSNLFAGIIIILTRPLKEGDRILVYDYEGTVERIRILSTVINTLTNETIIVPNAHLVSDPVHNYSFSDRSIVIRNDVGVAYKTDLDKAVALLEEMTVRNPYAEPGKTHNVRVKEFGGSSINIAVFTWIKDVSDKYSAHHWTNMEIWKLFRDNDVEIPFTQIDLHVKENGKI